uniref:DUF148 domain-containing protein n=1 Tax=Syphacia muris TaxID=451379 RepID=A0A0N5AUS1_9BILA
MLHYCAVIAVVVLANFAADAQYIQGQPYPQQPPTTDPGFMEMMMPPFLRASSLSARQEFEAIVTNGNLKKAEITAKVDEWAKRQPQQIQDAFEREKKMQLDMMNLMNSQRKRLVQGLSKEAQAVAASIDALRDNQNITPAEEVEKVLEIFRNTTESVVYELRSVDAQMAPMGDAAQMPIN